ncbi:MAG: molybdenum cofactor biosynthesis protein MoaE [Nitrospirae bacterium]|nr:molybdenum cofactor biosynthesis protein MoaE [Candidatus Troglogloeales bacterium]
MIQSADFSVEEEIAKMKAISSRMGGIVTFLGTARDFSKGHDVVKLTFEHYSKMAEQAMLKIRESALEQFSIIDVMMIHRIGEIGIGENIVLIVVGAEHRQDAFTACAWCIDELKKTVPIWKREETPDGQIWVEERP